MGLATTPADASGHAGRRDEESLLRQYAANRDPELRRALAERYLPLVRSLARRYARGSEPLDDLVQVGSIGLLNAIDRFDPEKGTAFSSFAVPTILGEIKRHFRDRTWSVRVPRDLQTLAVRFPAAESELEARLGRIPTATELATHLGTDVEHVLGARLVASAQYATSLEQALRHDDPDAQTLADRFATYDDGFALVEEAFTDSEWIQGLDERSREILRLRFEEELTQTEIGERVGLSQMHVSRLIRDALHHIARTRG